MPRHRLLPHEELEAQPVELLLELVDPIVVEDDRVGESAVLRHQRLEACRRRAFGERPHLGHLVSDEFDPLAEILVEQR